MKKLYRDLCITLALMPTAFLSTLANARVRNGFATLGTANIHYGVYDSETESQGDVLYIHGFGDRFENHVALFDSFNRAGLRVIAFDLPSHGYSSGAAGDDLNKQTFDKLVTIASQVLSLNRGADDQKPLILAGWSLGGLLATRIAQDEKYQLQFPKLSGLILYAPSLAPKPCVGNLFCQISNATLTHNELLQDSEIKPKSPLNYLAFDTRLVLAAAKAWRASFPSELSTLVFLADSNDRYVFSEKIVDWVKLQRANYISHIPAYSCKGARHELDNETTEFGGAFVRDISAEFANLMVRGEHWEGKLSSHTAPCQAF